jgi:hypothetical protein
VATAGFGARMGCLLVALAEAFDATLLTMDERLARAHGPTCRIDVLGVAVIVVGSSPNPQRSATLPITRTPSCERGNVIYVTSRDDYEMATVR